MLGTIFAVKIMMTKYRLYTGCLLALLLSCPLYGQELSATVLAADSMVVSEVDSLATDSLPEVVLEFPAILTDMPNVHVEQDSLITLLMEEKKAGVERGEREMPGYRVQIYSSNHPQRGKSEALQIEQRVKKLVHEHVYVTYTSPSWKVRLGDFRTQEEAATFRDAFKMLCPDLADYTYIVRDQIKIR